jgi:uncharacterized membrane protein
MIRASLKKHYIGMNKEFRYRGEEPTRMETLSDAVFALAITMLLISTSAPSNFQQLRLFVLEIIPFAMCIALITILWYEHFVFFIRYSFRSKYIVLLNSILLFILLFYVYPLKFLTKVIFSIFGWMFTDSDFLINQFKVMMKGGNMAELMIIYGFGAASLFLVFALMYRYAYKNSNELELNEVEKFDTRWSIKSNVLMASIPLLSALLAMIFSGNDRLVGMVSGFIYFLYTPVMLIYGRIHDKKRKILISELTLAEGNQLLVE